MPASRARKVLESIVTLVDDEFPGRSWYPFGLLRQVWGVVGEKLIGELLVDEFRAAFGDVDDQEVDELAASFRYDRCTPRAGLVDLLRRAATAAPA